MRRFLRRTRVRLAATVALVFLGVASVAAAATWFEFSRLQYGTIDATLSGQAQLLLAGVEDVNGRVTFQGGDPLPSETRDGIAVSAIILDAHGTVLARSGSAPAPTAVAAVTSDALRTRSAVTTTVSDGAQASRVVAQPVDFGTGAPAALVVTRPLLELQDTLLKLGLLLVAVVSALTLLVALLAYRVAGRALRPVRAIAATARDLSEHDLHRRLALDLPPDELGELADTFNAMIARLEASFTTQQQFTADAAHELRAPLAMLRAELEVSLARLRTPEDYRASQRTALAEVERLSATADQLLLLARADAGVLLPALQPVDLADLVDETVERWRALARVRQVRIEADVAHEGAMMADPLLLRRLLDNLIDNAVRHTPHGGGVRVALEGTVDTWTIVVSDSGPGIPREQRPALFERFTRGDSARGRETGGAGLGLALARVIAAAHRGDITLDECRSGAAFRIRLPRRQSGG
jgi:heavy metal sensor kinase